MATSYRLPIQEEVRDLLADLTGKGIAVDKASRLELGPDAPGLVAAYITDDGSTGAVALVDVPFACRAGAALSMVPKPVADEGVKREEVPENLLENLREVVNIMARFLNSASTPHLRLSAVHAVPGELPADVDTLRTSPAERRDFVVSITGYGEGKLSLLVS